MAKKKLTDDEQFQLACKVGMNATRCPFCGSGVLKFEGHEGAVQLSCAVTCEACGATWSNHYAFETASDFTPGNKK